MPTPMIEIQSRALAPHGPSQGGFVLITGLLILVAMSLIGVTMMNVSRLETMMAGGAREANIAFQAAEAALRGGEALIEGSGSAADFELGNPGMLPMGTDEPADLFAAATWTNSNSREVDDAYPEVTSQPRYIAKHVMDIVDSSSAGQGITIGGYTQGGTLPETAVFRVTTRGTSRDGSSEVFLQSYYGKLY